DEVTPTPRLPAEIASYRLWALWYSIWLLAGLWTSRVKARPALGVGVLHRILASAGAFLLLFLPPPGRAGAFAHGAIVGGFARPLWSEPPAVSWAFFALTCAAFGFCWWARLHLGRLWSGFVTTKVDHRIVDTGPYRLVRHPIYTGAIFAALTTACIKASPAAFMGFALIFAGFWLTARIEEKFLRQQLGAESYDAYSRRTPMLIPLVS
ncbi:MAG: methyltransferase family protein, partial [Caulobacteraceae bacterium]